MAGLLEICVDSLASARAAIRGGADRLELCSALTLGGLTPYEALLQQIRAETRLSLRCLIRPRAGDFLYTQEEIQLMCSQISTLKDAGADGFVIGCLTPAGDLDCDSLKPLIAAAEGAGLTLHRCIDVSRDPLQTYLSAARLGFDTVLTSGAAGSCTAGVDMIASMLALRDTHNGPEVLIGAGVNAENIQMLTQSLSGARAFHASCKKMIESQMTFRNPGIPMGLPGLDEWHIQQTDEQQVRIIKNAIQ